ncbi:MAG: hypothetical protein ONB33_14180 [candidate division KSB1 bacterium]|nr:hypothetical protein [candidate division KSB1 bacterium]MDZ7358741.1 hypothetical protein [candidate division KSB1 bacterium]MDZ7400276.1 hypothetical protein [candidate division KSB1 bacterium]
MNEKEQYGFRHALNSAHRIALTNSGIKSAPRTMVGKWIGVHHFQPIPSALIPYLELTSILHIGSQTHFGCETYILSA